jgi:hypothetical protein
MHPCQPIAFEKAGMVLHCTQQGMWRCTATTAPGSAPPVAGDVGHRAQGVKGLSPGQRAGDAVHTCRGRGGNHQVELLAYRCVKEVRSWCDVHAAGCLRAHGTVAQMCHSPQSRSVIKSTQGRRNSSSPSAVALTDDGGLLLCQLVHQLLVAGGVDVADQPAGQPGTHGSADAVVPRAEGLAATYSTRHKGDELGMPCAGGWILMTSKTSIETREYRWLSGIGCSLGVLLQLIDLLHGGGPDLEHDVLSQRCIVRGHDLGTGSLELSILRRVGGSCDVIML